MGCFHSCFKDQLTNSLEAKEGAWGDGQQCAQPEKLETAKEMGLHLPSTSMRSPVCTCVCACRGMCVQQAMEGDGGAWLSLITQVEAGDFNCDFSPVSLGFLDPTILESFSFPYKKLKPTPVQGIPQNELISTLVV